MPFGVMPLTITNFGLSQPYRSRFLIIICPKNLQNRSFRQTLKHFHGHFQTKNNPKKVYNIWTIGEKLQYFRPSHYKVSGSSFFFQFLLKTAIKNRNLEKNSGWTYFSFLTFRSIRFPCIGFSDCSDHGLHCFQTAEQFCIHALRSKIPLDSCFSWDHSAELIDQFTKNIPASSFKR